MKFFLLSLFVLCASVNIEAQWKLKYNKDQFGDYTNESYGEYISNSGTSRGNIPLNFKIIIEKSESGKYGVILSFKKAGSKYGYIPLPQNYTINIKKDDGTTLKITNEDQEVSDKLISLFKKSYKLKFYIGSFGNNSFDIAPLQFTVNCNGATNVINKVNGSELFSIDGYTMRGLNKPL